MRGQGKAKITCSQFAVSKSKNMYLSKNPVKQKNLKLSDDPKRMTK